jgi:hypothetical protein
MKMQMTIKAQNASFQCNQHQTNSAWMIGITIFLDAMALVYASRCKIQHTHEKLHILLFITLRRMTLLYNVI